ncbi:MAG: hypothetical protein ABWY27_07055 [Telluria sp.]
MAEWRRQVDFVLQVVARVAQLAGATEPAQVARNDEPRVGLLRAQRGDEVIELVQRAAAVAEQPVEPRKVAVGRGA